MVPICGGRIIIDGVDINNAKLLDLRSNLAIIPQDPVLFQGTIRFNLDPFSNYTDEQLWAVLEKSYLKAKIISFPLKLHSLVTENGENFSIGERAQICLARALLRLTTSSILALDEATASLDRSTDDQIQYALKLNTTNITTITIAHRLETIIDYQRVMVMDNGKVMEFDTPNKLLRDPTSHFYSLVQERGKTFLDYMIDQADLAERAREIENRLKVKQQTIRSSIKRFLSSRTGGERKHWEIDDENNIDNISRRNSKLLNHSKMVEEAEDSDSDFKAETSYNAEAETFLAGNINNNL
jgi:ABC-type multidrug transport system ATPase subunit